jgi:hypothetical protein
MSCARYLLAFLLVITLASAFSINAIGIPASNFTKENGDWYDNWGIDRNDPGYGGDLPGYLPHLANETLGANKELAYSIGQQFQDEYPDKVSRAVAILKYVQTWTYYGYDSDNFIRNGVAQGEWAQNADEFAHAFDPTTGVTAVGDCEDMAFLCGTIYVGAGFDAAVIDAPYHAALLIWLPDFSNANDYWDINDGRGAGWIWVEATGSSNPLGWTPSDFENGDWTAYPINSLEFVAYSPTQSTSTDLPCLGGVAQMSFGLCLVWFFMRRPSK